MTRKSFGPVIVIRRGDEHALALQRDALRARTFGVATGQSQYPTPLGRFRVVVKWKNPWWYPPDSPWAKDMEPVPPGPGNPLGTRWMGISSPGVGIHGTPEPGSIGYSVSHGCIRMRIPDAEWLFEQDHGRHDGLHRLRVTRRTEGRGDSSARSRSSWGFSGCSSGRSRRTTRRLRASGKPVPHFDLPTLSR